MMSVYHGDFSLPGRPLAGRRNADWRSVCRRTMASAGEPPLRAARDRGGHFWVARMRRAARAPGNPGPKRAMLRKKIWLDAAQLYIGQEPTSSQTPGIPGRTNN